MKQCSGQSPDGGESSEVDLDELARLAQKLDDMEGMLQELELTEASLEEIEEAVARLGEGMAGENGKKLLIPGGKSGMGRMTMRRPGGGDRGRASGRRPTAEGGKTGLDKTRSPSKTGKGPMVASWYFKGKQVKGEAKKDYGKAVQAARDRAADAVGERKIPRRYESTVKRYFGDLEKIGEKGTDKGKE